MKTSKILAILFLLILPCAVSLYAEWFDGEVQAIDVKNKTITLSEVDPITDIEEKKELLVDGTTVFSGVSSLKDIRKNDNATIEAQYDEKEDVWKALSIEVAEAGS